MDPIKINKLIEEDSLSTRGINFNQTLTSAKIHKQKLDEEEYLDENYNRNERNDREMFSDDEDGDSSDDMAWEPPRENNNNTRGNQVRYQISDRESPRRHRRSQSRAEAETLRIMWWKSAGINVLFMLAWYLFSTLLSIYNKWMFSTDHYNFPYPLFVTSIHMFVQWGLSALTLGIFRHLRPASKPAKKDFITKVVPCGVATGLDIGLSNLSLRTITLSFYTMCKSSSLAFVLLFAFLFRLETPSWRLAGVIFIITSGVVLMVSTETQFDATGMIEVLSASALGGLRWSLTQMLLDKEAMGMGNPIATLFWLAPIMGITLASCSIIFDGWGNVFSNKVFFGSVAATFHTIGTILLPGVIAFMMNVTEFGLIQRTSVVTLSVGGIFKEVAVIFLSMFIFHDQLTPINISGLTVTLFGIGLYNYLKYTQFTQGGDSMSQKPGFVPLEEDNHRNNHSISLENLHPYSEPLHTLGDSPASSSSSLNETTSRPSHSPPPILHIMSKNDKQRQHDESRTEGLDKVLENDSTLIQLDLEEHQMIKSMEKSTEHSEAGEDWDLLLNGERKERV